MAEERAEAEGSLEVSILVVSLDDGSKGLEWVHESEAVAWKHLHILEQINRANIQCICMERCHSRVKLQL